METFGLFCIILVLGSLVSRFPVIAVNKTEELESQITGARRGGGVQWAAWYWGVERPALGRRVTAGLDQDHVQDVAILRMLPTGVRGILEITGYQLQHHRPAEAMNSLLGPNLTLETLSRP